MPSSSSLSIRKFLNDYKQFLDYLTYMRDWAQTAQSLANILQRNESYSSILSSEEAATVESAKLVCAQIFQSVEAVAPKPKDIHEALRDF